MKEEKKEKKEMKDGFHDLGSKPESARIGESKESNPWYPNLSINTDNYPPLKEMKLGSEGRAEIKFRISKEGRGIEILGIKPCGTKEEK